MSSSLFQEALADARQLREVAEQNAKNAIIDSVTPKIRQFIEEQLLEGAKKDVVEEVDDLDLDVDGDTPISDADTLMERNQLLRSMDGIVESLTPEESLALISVVEKMRVGPQTSGISDSRKISSDVRSTHIVKENAAMQKEKVYEVDLAELMSGGVGDEGEHMMELDDPEMMDEGDFDAAMASEGRGKHDKHAKHSMEDDYSMDEMGADDEMADLYESLAALFEAEEDEGETDDDTPVDAEGPEGGMPETEEMEEGGVADQLNTLIQLVQDMKGEVDEIKAAMESGAGAAPAEPEGMPDMPEPPSMGGEEMGGELPPGAEPAPEMGGKKEETVYRVNESILLRELSKLREGKNLGTGMTPAKKAGVASGSKFISEKNLGTGMTPAKRSGVAGGSKFLSEEAPEEEGLHLEETEEGAKHKKGSANGNGNGKLAVEKVMKQNRDLKESLSRHAEAVDTLRAQLTEMNLFNAKLLYVNRLLQDRDLSDAQRRTIIESLDRARSLREVKLLYKGLSESIGRNRGRTGASVVNESVNRAVSPTSRPLSTSGVRLTEAVEVQRWSVLAGINKA
jgi:hypothetical protein